MPLSPASPEGPTSCSPHIMCVCVFMPLSMRALPDPSRLAAGAGGPRHTRQPALGPGQSWDHLSFPICKTGRQQVCLQGRLPERPRSQEGGPSSHCFRDDPRAMGPLDPAGSPHWHVPEVLCVQGTGACRGQLPGPHVLRDLVANGHGWLWSVVVLAP